MEVSAGLQHMYAFDEGQFKTGTPKFVILLENPLDWNTFLSASGCRGYYRSALKPHSLCLTAWWYFVGN